MPPLPKSSVRKAVYPGPALPGIRPDWPPAPECERVHMRARLADGTLSPDRPLLRNDSTDAARGLWRKIVLHSSELRGFAPSREPVIIARPVLLPLSSIACQASQPALTTARQPRTARPKGHEPRMNCSDRIQTPFAPKGATFLGM